MKIPRMLLLLFLLFVGIRLYFILTFPPFTDESLYIRWGMVMRDKPEFRWASLEHIHRQPLGFWLFGLGASVFTSPLIGARLLVLLFNIPVFYFVTSLSKKIAGHKTVLISASVLTFTPFFILIQSLALMDGLLFALISGLIWLLLTRDRRLTTAEYAASGAMIAAALWTKNTALLYIPLTVITLGILYLNSRIRSIHILTDSMYIFFTATVLLLPLVLHPDARYILSEPGTFITIGPPFQFLKQWLTNMADIGAAFLLYIGVPVVSLLCLRRLRVGRVWPASWLLLPVTVFILLSNSIRLRYIIPGSIILIPYISGLLLRLFTRTRSRIIPYAYWTLVTVYCLFFIIRPAVFFSYFPVSSKERDYAISWPSGYGIPDLIRYIDEQAAGTLMVIAVADSPGNPGDYILSQYYRSSHIKVVFVTITSPEELRKIEPLTQKIPVHLATRESLIIPSVRPYLIPIKRFPKPDGLDTISLYRISFQ